MRRETSGSRRGAAYFARTSGGTVEAPCPAYAGVTGAALDDVAGDGAGGAGGTNGGGGAAGSAEDDPRAAERKTQPAKIAKRMRRVLPCRPRARNAARGRTDMLRGSQLLLRRRQRNSTRGVGRRRSAHARHAMSSGACKAPARSPARGTRFALLGNGPSGPKS